MKIFRTAILNSSLVAVALGLFLGFMMKFFVPLNKYSQIYIYMHFPSLLHLRLLHVVTTPLVYTGVAIGVCSKKIGLSGKVELHASRYMITTIFLSLTLGLTLVLYIEPGVDARTRQPQHKLIDSLLNVLLNIVPKNIVLNTSQQYKTVGNKRHFIQRINVLGLIVWAYVIGINNRLHPADTLRKIFAILNEATTLVVKYILGFLPFSLVFMGISLVIETNDWKLIFKLGKFMGVVVLGLTIHATLVLPLIYFLCARHNPYAVVKGVFSALMTAFVSSSSSATLPLTLKCCEQRLKIDKKICLLLPIWANTNMNGTVIYEVVAGIFIAQVHNLHMDLSQLIVIIMVSAVPCLGITGTPARGAATTFLNLAVAGFPVLEVCLLVVIQYLLDRCNTFLNILGHCFGVALIQVSESGLGDMEQGQEMYRVHGSDAEDSKSDRDQQLPMMTPSTPRQ